MNLALAFVPEEGSVARLGEPTGPNKEQAQLARQWVGKLSLRGIANKVGGKFSHDSARRILNGERVGVDILDQFSRGFGKNVNELRTLGGYGVIPAELSSQPDDSSWGHRLDNRLDPTQAVREALAVLQRADVGQPVLPAVYDALIGPAFVQLPVVGRVAAGTPILSVENIESHVPIPVEWLPRSATERAQCFALRVRGDSMVGADIQDGDILAIRPATQAEDGKVVAVLVNGEATVKRFRIVWSDERLRKVRLLYSDPEDYMDPIELVPDQARIIGVPVGFLRGKPESWG